jgi:MoaD family protein
MIAHEALKKRLGIDKGEPMAIKVHIPTPMRLHTEGLATVEVAGGTVQAVLNALGQSYPPIVAKLFDNGQVRRFVNIYLNDEDIRYLDNMATAVKDGDEVSIIPAVAGG